MSGYRGSMIAHTEEDEQAVEYSYCEIKVKNYIDVYKSMNFPEINVFDFYEATRNESMRNTYPEIEEVTGDLFSADLTWAFAHCVSADLAMFRGIAVDFRRRYGNIGFLREQNATPGHVAVQNYFEPNDGHGRFLFYLVTKTLYCSKPTIFNIYCCLCRLRMICEALNVTKVAMPRIGSGCDRMEFRFVRHLIYLVFKDSQIRIRIYSFH